MEVHPAHRIRLEVFEGPLDLLLHLVKISEMDIYDIEISTITQQYMNYISAMQEMDLEIAGDYLVMAATLLNIKSRSLLPRNAEEEELTAEEEIDEIMSTQELVRRLVEFRRFKELTRELRAREEENSKIFYRANVIQVVPGANRELPRHDILMLFDAFASVLKRVRLSANHHVGVESFTVEEKVVQVRERLRMQGQVNLSRVFDTCVSKAEVVCYFLAVLELARMREITLAQADLFEDILIEPWDEKVIHVG